MDVLLDTHMLLWWLSDDPQLPPRARSMIASRANRPLVSAATAWEIAIKERLGKLTIDQPIADEIEREGFAAVPITIAHAAETAALPPIHRDPFDRLLIAQALEEEVPLLSADEILSAYGIRRLW